MIEKPVQKWMLPSYFNQFWVAEVLEEGVQNDALNAILEEYRKPVKIFSKRKNKRLLIVNRK
jgi:hypothetical protein